MSTKFSHLTEKQLEQLIERYYNREKIADLIKEYNLDLNPSQFVKNLPPEILDEECDYCEVRMIRKRQSRDYHWGEDEGVCPSCGHRDNPLCVCRTCKENEKARKQKEQQLKQEVLKQILYYDASGKVDLDTLSFTEKVYLGALLREGITEDYNLIKPLSLFINPFAPTEEFQNEIIKLLYRKGAIKIHPETAADSILVDDAETGEYRYYPYNVSWILNVKQEGLTKVPLIDSITNPLVLAIESYEEALELWKVIALKEVLEYFDHSVINILGVDYSVGEKTISVFKDLLREYSVSQIYGIIYRSVNSALRFQKERGVSLKHAANSIVGSAQSYGERAKVNKWELQKYKRIVERPESALSKFFFERVIRVGYSGFNEVPSIELIAP